MSNDLIPCTDELNRLKTFLANFKKPTLRYAGEDHVVVGLQARNLVCGHNTPFHKHLKNYGGPYDVRLEDDLSDKYKDSCLFD